MTLTGSMTENDLPFPFAIDEKQVEVDDDLDAIKPHPRPLPKHWRGVTLLTTRDQPGLILD